MITEVDDQLGRLFAWLDESGQADHTFVVFTSDHGELLGDHWLTQKMGWFDTAYHVPLIVRGPGVERGRTVRRDDRARRRAARRCASCSTPTRRCSATAARSRRGCTARRVDGWRDAVYHEMDLRDPASTFLEDAFGITLEECSLAVLRDEHGKYVQFAGHETFAPIFFDIDEDPAQLVNRAADPAYAPKVLDYAQRMLAWRLTHAERTLTGMKLTGHAGLVERNAVRK